MKQRILNVKQIRGASVTVLCPNNFVYFGWLFHPFPWKKRPGKLFNLWPCPLKNWERVVRSVWDNRSTNRRSR